MKTKLQLDESISSPQDLKILILEIRDYAKWYSHNSVKRLLKARKLSDAPELSVAAQATLHSWNAQNPLSRRGLDQLIVYLEKTMRSAPQITITLSAPPTSSIKKTLVSWCRKNTSPAVLVNFEFNSTLLGGMVVRSGSHIYDWSFRRQILEAKQRFPGVLRNV